MSKLTYLFVILLVTQSFCQEVEGELEAHVEVEGELEAHVEGEATATIEWNLENVSNIDLKDFEGNWDIQAILVEKDDEMLGNLLFYPVELKVRDSSLEALYRFIDPTTNQPTEETIQLTQDPNDKSRFLLDPSNPDDYIRIVYYEKVEVLISGDVIEVGGLETGEMGEMEIEHVEMEGEIDMGNFELESGLEGEAIDVGSGEIGTDTRELGGEILIVEVMRSDNHYLIALTRNFDGVFDLRRFLREHDIKYTLRKNYFQYPILSRFIYPIAENLTIDTIEGDWRLLGVYETEEYGRILPWELGYCPKISLSKTDKNSLKIDFKIDLLYDGSIQRVWTVFPREDEKGVVVGFVSTRPIPIGVVDLNEEGLLVAATNDGSAFLLGSPKFTRTELTQDDINYFKRILNDKLNIEVYDFWLNLFYQDECKE